jgi:hypothetical protein
LDASIACGLPAAPDFAGAAFGVCLRDTAALVCGAAETLDLGFWLAGLRTAGRDTGVDLARKGLALGEGCSTVNEEGAVYGHPISPRTSITSRLNIICFRQA